MFTEDVHVMDTLMDASKNFEDCLENYSSEIWAGHFNMKNLIRAARYNIMKLLDGYDGKNQVIVPFFALIEALRWKNFDFAIKLIEMGEKFDCLFIEPFFQAIAFAKYGHEYVLEITKKYELNDFCWVVFSDKDSYINYIDSFFETIPLIMRGNHYLRSDFFMDTYESYFKSDDENILDQFDYHYPIIGQSKSLKRVHGGKRIPAKMVQPSDVRKLEKFYHNFFSNATIVHEIVTSGNLNLFKKYTATFKNNEFDSYSFDIAVGENNVEIAMACLEMFGIPDDSYSPLTPFPDDDMNNLRDFIYRIRWVAKHEPIGGFWSCCMPRRRLDMIDQDSIHLGKLLEIIKRNKNLGELFFAVLKSKNKAFIRRLEEVLNKDNIHLVEEDDLKKIYKYGNHPMSFNKWLRKFA